MFAIAAVVYFSFHEPRLLLTLERSSGKIPALFEILHSARGNPTTFIVTGIRDLAFSPDGKRIVTSGPDYDSRGICIKAWDAVTGKHLLTITNASLYGANACFSADGKQLVAPSFGGATFWDATSGRAVRTFQSQAITDFVAISPDGKLVAIANWTDQNARYSL